jgi:hypothetical protein
MGGAIVLAIATLLFNSYTMPLLSEYLTRYSLTQDAIFSSQGLEALAVRMILARGFNCQMFVLSTFAAAQIPTSLLLWRKDHIRC